MLRTCRPFHWAREFRPALEGVCAAGEPEAPGTVCPAASLALPAVWLQPFIPPSIPSTKTHTSRTLHPYRLPHCPAGFAFKTVSPNKHGEPISVVSGQASVIVDH